MTKTWVIADPHFGHANILRFTNFDGSKVRPWEDVKEMDEALVANWNDRVGDQDRIYVLGDVVMHHRNLPILERLKGRKVLVRGNHDLAKLSQYAKYFDDVRGIVVKKGFCLSHVPIHPDCITRWGINIHGHLHGNRIDDDRYVCVSVERTGYAPVDIQTILDGKWKP